ncbi:uncharacterized protein [Anoplolepis gracilipes]|uniref:uncharacterized protein n=1 Tax=Anoplolepis gracilipes TaxID=354296 RepID=UPI003B9F1043
MLLYTLNIFSVVTFILCGAEELTLPVTTCKRNSTEYLACLKVASEEAWPRFAEGLPEFDFPRLEPFFYKYVKIVFNRNGIYGEANLTNSTLSGLANARFLDLRPYFLDNVFQLEVDVLIPKVFLDTYANGEINPGGMRVDVTASHVNVTIDESRMTWKITGHVKNDTWTIEHFRTTVTIEKLKFHFVSFNGAREFADVMEVIMNENWPSIYRVVGPVVFKILDPIFTDFCNRLFSKVSLSKVFP